jgi:hypothetical protein
MKPDFKQTKSFHHKTFYFATKNVLKWIQRFFEEKSGLAFQAIPLP